MTKLQIKRGLDAGRTFTPASGELIFSTDTKRLFVGDGTTAGGIGICPLDSSSKIETKYLPVSITGQVHYNGVWNASTNTPSLTSASADKGGYYIVSAAGTYNSTDYQVGDWVISDGTNWNKVDNTDSISSWNGRTGAITPLKSDYSAWFLDTTTGDARYYTQTQSDSRYLKLSTGGQLGGRLNLYKNGAVSANRNTHGFGFANDYSGLVSFWGSEANAINALGTAGAGASDGPFVYGYNGVSLGYSSAGITNGDLVAALRTTGINVIVAGTITEGGSLLSAKYAPLSHTHTTSQITGLDTTLSTFMLKNAGVGTGEFKFSNGTYTDPAVSYGADAKFGGLGIATAALRIASLSGLLRATGGVVSSTTLSASDIPVLDWSKITTGKPTTLAGYGITDASLSTHTHTFASLTSKPTTLSGYGITDAATSTHNHDSVYLALTGGTLSNTLRITKDNTVSTAANNSVFTTANLVVERATNDTSTTTVAGIGFRNSGSGFNNCALFYLDPADGVFKYNKGTGVISSFWTSENFTGTQNGHNHSGVYQPAGSYAASVHTHAWADITSGKPTTLAGYGITDAVGSSDARLTDARTPINNSFYVFGDNGTASRNITDFNAVIKSGFGSGQTATGTPGTGWYHIITNKYHGDTTGWLFQIAAGFGMTAGPATPEGYYVRIKEGTSAPGAWRTLWHSGNLTGDQSGHYHSADRAWANITGVPSTFAPSAHNHDTAYVKLTGGVINGWIGTSGYSSYFQKDVAISASPNTNYTSAPIRVERVTTTGTTYHAGIGFHNNGTNASFLYYSAADGDFYHNENMGGNYKFWTTKQFSNTDVTNWQNGLGRITSLETRMTGVDNNWVNYVAKTAMTGTTNQIPLFTGANSLGNSILFQDTAWGVLNIKQTPQNNQLGIAYYNASNNKIWQNTFRTTDNKLVFAFYDGTNWNGERMSLDGSGNAAFAGNVTAPNLSYIGHNHGAQYIDFASDQTISGNKTFASVLRAGQSGTFEVRDYKSDEYIANNNCVWFGYSGVYEFVTGYAGFRANSTGSVFAGVKYNQAGYLMSQNEGLFNENVCSWDINKFKVFKNLEVVGTATFGSLAFGGGAITGPIKGVSRAGDGGAYMFAPGTGSITAISNGTSTALIHRYAYSGFTGFVASNTEFYGICNDHSASGGGAELSIVAGQTNGHISFFAGTPTLNAKNAYQAPMVGNWANAGLSITGYLNASTSVTGSNAAMSAWAINGTYAWFGKAGTNGSTWATANGMGTNGSETWLASSGNIRMCATNNTDAFWLTGTELYSKNSIYSFGSFVGSVVAPSDSLGSASRLGVLSSNKQNGWCISYGANGDLQFWSSSANNWTMRHRFTDLATKLPIYATLTNISIAQPLYDGEVRLYKGNKGAGACYLKCRGTSEPVRYRSDAGAIGVISTANANIPVDIQSIVVMLIWSNNGTDGYWTMLS